METPLLCLQSCLTVRPAAPAASRLLLLQCLPCLAQWKMCCNCLGISTSSPQTKFNTITTVSSANPFVLEPPRLLNFKNKKQETLHTTDYCLCKTIKILLLERNMNSMNFLFCGMITGRKITEKTKSQLKVRGHKTFF